LKGHNQNHSNKPVDPGRQAESDDNRQPDLYIVHDNQTEIAPPVERSGVGEISIRADGFDGADNQQESEEDDGR